jgi:hypothetical protein
MPKGEIMIIAYQENGISKEREATAEEYAAITQLQQEYAQKRAAELAKAEADIIAKNNLLERLGITAEEAALLLG